MAQLLAIKRLMDLDGLLLLPCSSTEETHLRTVCNHKREGYMWKWNTSEDHINVPCTRWAPPGAYVTTCCDVFLHSLSKETIWTETSSQGQPFKEELDFRPTESVNRICVLNVLGLGSPLGGCGPLKKRIWSGHILANALLCDFSGCKAPLSLQQTSRKT